MTKREKQKVLKVKFVFEPSSDPEVKRRWDKAFDILFDEVHKSFLAQKSLLPLPHKRKW